ncbi:DUF6491 family protein [Phenylobacterium sp.]|uniref:DUF6491 family protein n=1 Tax=Phenylobacterium sp. TaxID=1871053 RepID=UPI0035AD7FEF
MKPRTPLAALAAAALAGALATTAAAEPAAKPDAAKTEPAKNKECFWARSINGFSPVDDETVNIHVGANDVYQMKLFSPSPDIKWTERIALKSHGSSWICSGLDATVIVPSPIGPQRYPVTSIRKLTPAEVAALSSRAKR